ncbi:right-handed parallel beta-helix repeat-containing protein [Nakamurella panacisegetis]|uniref:right-handed parallel beta-helix repeat-containing protein n=1 Tax=Nakamurella panacisegetis TaxID=1090615 RepID=UPI001560D5E6|nr:right-handed parallel beta-helix repeat-containing protein [Nakamurella panacisegetis]
MSQAPRHSIRTSRSKRVQRIAISVFTAAVAGGIVVPVASSASAAGATWTNIAVDTYSRTTSGGLGSADLGGAYTTAKGTGSGALSVTGGHGVLEAVQPGTATSVVLTQTSAADVHLQGTVRAPAMAASAFGLYHGLQARRQNDGSAYIGRVRLAPGGALSVSVSRVSGSSDTLLKDVRTNLTAAPGTLVKLAFEVTGTDPVVLSARAWLSGSAEPGWQLTAQDTSPSRITKAGAVGQWDYVSRSSVATTVVVDDFWAAKRLTAGAPVTTPPPAVPPAVTAPATTTHGALPIGTAQYAVPSNAIFVNPNSGNDSGSGTMAAPYRTVTYAVSRAAAGQTVVLRGGTYHESVIVNDRPITIQAYPAEAVWFDGSSAVTGWTKSGSTWVKSGWTKTFDSSIGFSFGQNNSVFLQSGFPMASHPDQVYIDGVQLKQVATAASVVPGTFAVNYASKQLIIGSDPANHQVRATDIEQAIRVNVAGVVLRGFGVRRYGTPMPLMGAVRFNKPGSVENVEIDDVAANALSFSGSNASANHVTVNRAGQMGLHADTADNLVVKNSLFNQNNYEHFNPWIATGGIKITKTRNAVISGNTVINTYGTGIWFDESSVNIRIVGNTVTGNTEAGIETELSDTMTIANNTVTGGKTGIYLFNAGNGKIYNNRLGGSSDQGIWLSQNGRRQANASEPGHDPRYPIPDPTCPWILRNVQIVNNSFGEAPTDHIMVLDKATNVGADSMNITINGNLFSKKVSASDSNLLAWGGTNNQIASRMTSVAQLSAKNAGWRNAESATSTALAGLTTQESAFSSFAVALPADVASAVGVASGTKKIGTF